MSGARTHRFTRAVAAATLALGLLPGLAGAAVPDATAQDEAIPAAYSAGNLAGFRGSLSYTDSSTLAKLYLRINVAGASAIDPVIASLDGTATGTACTTTGSTAVDCTWRTVRDGDVARVTIGVTPASEATSVTAEYVWSSTGATSSDGGTSHGDTWTDPDGIATATLSTDPDYAGGFFVQSGGTVGNAAASDANPQSTKLAKLPAAVAATVEDGAGASGACTDVPGFVCSQTFGQWSEVHVGDGQAFTSAFEVVITYTSLKGAPKGFVHALDGGGQELIGPCAKRNPTLPCFTWSSRTGAATILTLANGSYKGYN